MITAEQAQIFGDWIIAVNKMGSSVLPWIDNPHDLDYEVYVKDIKDRKKLAELYSYREDKGSMFARGECWFSREKRPCAPYCYQYHFAQKVYGEDIPKFDIFENKEDYMACLVKSGLGETNYNGKFWYHILTGIYMLENGDYFLTDEQIVNVRLCHDKQMTDDIYNYIQKKLEEFSKLVLTN